MKNIATFSINFSDQIARAFILLTIFQQTPSSRLPTVLILSIYSRQSRLFLRLAINSRIVKIPPTFCQIIELFRYGSRAIHMYLVPCQPASLESADRRAKPEKKIDHPGGFLVARRP